MPFPAPILKGCNKEGKSNWISGEHACVEEFIQELKGLYTWDKKQTELSPPRFISTGLLFSDFNLKKFLGSNKLQNFNFKMFTSCLKQISVLRMQTSYFLIFSLQPSVNCSYLCLTYYLSICISLFLSLSLSLSLHLISYFKEVSEKWKFLSSVRICDPMDCSPWSSPSQNTGVGSLSLLQGIFPTQGSNPGFPHCRWILYQLSHKGSPFQGNWRLEWDALGSIV